jgi:hypothetical protein
MQISEHCLQKTDVFAHKRLIYVNKDAIIRKNHLIQLIYYCNKCNFAVSKG